MTPDDERFLQAILADPDESGPRLIYADWLEEQGDPRAELLRLDCQLKETRSGRRAAQLLSRFEELCLAMPPDWVALVISQVAYDSIEDALRQLEGMLPGLNYVVSFGIHRIPLLKEPTTEGYIQAALGQEARVRGRADVAGAEVLAEVERCLRYPGDRGHGPDRRVLRSRAFKSLVRKVLDYLEESIAESHKVESFSLRAGHPFYPVMWDFAYVFHKRCCAVVFLGSSSD